MCVPYSCQDRSSCACDRVWPCVSTVVRMPIFKDPRSSMGEDGIAFRLIVSSMSVMMCMQEAQELGYSIGAAKSISAMRLGWNCSQCTQDCVRVNDCAGAAGLPWACRKGQSDGSLFMVTFADNNCHKQAPI